MGFNFDAMPQGLAVVVLIVLGVVAILALTTALFERFDPVCGVAEGVPPGPRPGCCGD